MANTSERRDPHPYAIAEWWARYQLERAPGGSFVLDIGEPSCFACGWYDETRPTYPEVSAPAAWKAARLERAHLHPHSLGGSNDPSNYVMLCRPCHREAPDWADPSVMLTWVVSREPYLTRFTSEFTDAWHAIRPGEPLPRLRVTDDHLMEKLTSQLIANAGLHFGIGIKTSTYAAAIAAVMDEAAHENTG